MNKKPKSKDESYWSLMTGLEKFCFLISIIAVAYFINMLYGI